MVQRRLDQKSDSLNAASRKSLKIQENQIFPPGIRTWPVAFGINSSTLQFSCCFVFVVRYIAPFIIDYE